jgi:hypothetical protein
MANEVVFAPLAAGGTISFKTFNWRIIPATAILAFACAGLEKMSPAYGKGIAYIALITVLFAKTGSAEPPAVNLAKVMGYKT